MNGEIVDSVVCGCGGEIERRKGVVINWQCAVEGIGE